MEIVLDGESLLNDGISLFLFHFAEGFYFNELSVGKTFSSFLSSLFLSPIFGIIIGIIVKNVIRKSKGGNIFEKGIVIVFVYLAFMIPEVIEIGMSGVLSVVFYGQF